MPCTEIAQLKGVLFYDETMCFRTKLWLKLWLKLRGRSLPIDAYKANAPADGGIETN